MRKEWLKTMAVFDEYERRFAAARAEKPLSSPWEPGDRDRILKETKRMLAYRDDLVPTVRSVTEMNRISYGAYDGISYRYETWDKFYGSATLFLPCGKGPFPLTFVCCGHGAMGKHSYYAMGHRLAQLGIAAVVSDNIGQGDRNFRSSELKNEDHWFADAPFYCGLTLQGLIVMETVALIDHFAKDPRFDPAKLAACGNSGGGTLTMFLAALAPSLSAIASCGYPSETAYLLQKERRHCACNLLIGAAYGPEMWEICSLFAPKPLLLEGGKLDNLIPLDLAHKNARKVRNTYVQMNAENKFEFTLTDTKHPWDLEDLDRISRFLSEALLGTTPAPMEEIPAFTESDLTVKMPEDMRSTASLCSYLTGKTIPDNLTLQDVFPPTFEGKPLDPVSIAKDVGRGDVTRVFAQFECTLYQKDRKE